VPASAELPFQGPFHRQPRLVRAAILTCLLPAAVAIVIVIICEF
jgi:hypothetical protein